jgi:hypothetical protein
LFNDTQSDVVRFVDPQGVSVAQKVITYPEADLDFAGIDSSKVARQGFARGLCLVAEDIIAVGSSPSTITLYDMNAQNRLQAVNLTMDVRNAVHGLEIWPFD